MRLIPQVAIAIAMIAQQVIASVQIPLTETARAAEATTVVPSNYTLTLNTKATSALELKAKKGSFDNDVVAPLKASQAAKAAAEAQKAQEAQAAANQAAASVARASAAPATTVALTGSDAEYKLYIYLHESGNNPTRTNGSGCIGLGQACPGAKLLRVCPTLDYACEDAFFTSYAIARYGSWAGAYSFWLTHHYW